MTVFIPRFLWSLAFLVTLIVLGTVGYMGLEGWALSDAVYMTVITVTAVGYKEVIPLSPDGRNFTMLVLLSGITWMGVWFALITSFIVELDLKDALRRRRAMTEIANLKDHIIICGAGRTGRQVVQELETVTSDYVVIERDPAPIEVLGEFAPDAKVVEGDATHDNILLDAGLLRADGLVTCLSADADNLFVCLSARDLAASLTIVARAYEEETMDKLYRAGADHVVSPNVSGAVRMASVLLRPSVVTFLDIVTRSDHMALRMEQVEIVEDSDLAGKTLMEARIPQRAGLIVIAVGKKGGPTKDFLFNPAADTRLEVGDQLIVLGTDEQIGKLRGVIA